MSEPAGGQARANNRRLKQKRARKIKYSRVLELILDVKRRGVPIILISHNIPHVFEVADRIHVHRLGRCLCVIDPKKQLMADAVAPMTGAKKPPAGTVF